MKKIVFTSIFIFTLLLCGCNEKGVLSGYTGLNCYSQGNMGDYTDYNKYYYTKNGDEKFKNSKLYTEVTQDNIDNLKSYFDNFSKVAEAIEFSKYDFNSSSITVGDYFFIETKEGEKIGESVYEKFDNYSVYLYDCETHTLFYIHNNI